jgi:hypothetical protein
MAAPLATLEEIRAILHQENDDTETDDRINRTLAETHSRLEIELGFTYEREVVTRRLDATDDSVLIIPGPGIDREAVITVVEDGTTLVEGTDFEVDPDNSRYLIRLDSLNKPKDWKCGRRIIVVTYVPARAPEALIAAERVETVRAYRGAQAGYADRVGVDGTSSIPYSHAFTVDTRRLLEALKRGDGVGVW